MINHHHYYMSIALEEAKKGWGFTSPNPMVGAVLVKNDKILARGYHQAWGQEHAEVMAIQKANKAQLSGSTLYVTLEPCCHFGKTPPCTAAIIKAGIKTVVIASYDEDNRVKNKSTQILRQKGISVITEVLKEEADQLNSIYFYYKKKSRPYIILKAACTLDGKIATRNRESKWISNDLSRERVHFLRSRIKAIAIGKKTVNIDQPHLNCRYPGFQNKPVDKLIFTKTSFYQGNQTNFASHTGKIYTIDPSLTQNPQDFLDFCLEKEIDSILVEGGSWLYTWFLEKHLVNCLYLFYKPAFLGNDGISVSQVSGIQSISKLKEFHIHKTEKLENNFLVVCVPEGEKCLLEL
ncbi:MAG: bifunctional diaminohydroxyphosphoribosylaminopyrimidine deaminase/5-amino-6-(5-phosphoribosylamino)uracil reductase RibD [Spirochaetes bacterium]|nr:bifunctional diaminohydroxyphosphoribosylaminopyrimidine deaminase/5-amino-6-(5-phosphoribosylamino)uracil reductase RibD [Spirochaetota bacterium]